MKRKFFYGTKANAPLARAFGSWWVQFPFGLSIDFSCRIMYLKKITKFVSKVEYRAEVLVRIKSLWLDDDCQFYEGGLGRNFG